MAGEPQILEAFNARVSDFIGRSPFFRSWREGGISPAVSGKFLVSFDCLVKSFPSLIAAGAARMEDEVARTVLAVNLYQECGEGDVARTHHAIYRKFLVTAGLPLPDGPGDGFALEWKADLLGHIASAPGPGALLGVLASGEFLAQPALTRLYSVLKPHYPRADQEYFTRHLVLETEHVREITSIIAPHAQTPGGWREVQSGFQSGLSAWETYFNRLLESVAAADPIL